MGIVQRQSAKNAIVNYLGVLIGGLSTLFIYPLDWEIYGSIQFYISTATLLSTFLALGSDSLVNKFFPHFKVQNIKGFLSLLLFYSTVNIAITSVLLLLFESSFFSLLSLGNFDIEEISENLFIILPIAFALVYIPILKNQSYNHGRIVMPDLISELGLKIFIPLLVVLAYFNSISHTTIGWLLVLGYFVIIVGLIGYLGSIHGLDFHREIFKKTPRKKHVEIVRYMLYSALNKMGDQLVYKIDIVMIGLILTTSKVGYYSIFLFLAAVIKVPTRAVYRITAPMISTAFETNDLGKIKELYRKSSINLYVIGIVIFAAIWMNINTLFLVMTNGEDLVKYQLIFLFLALVRVVDMLTSVNSHIISYSKYFRIKTAFILLLAISNLILNYYLIEKYDIIGAGIATFISMLTYNILKTSFVYYKFKIHPFSKNMVVLTLFLAISVIAPLYFPSLFQRFWSSTLISGVFLLTFIVLVYRQKIAPEINNMIDKYILRFIR